MATHGGARPNSGRKALEPTTTKRIPVSLVIKFEEWVADYKKLAAKHIPAGMQFVIPDAPVLQIPVANDPVRAGLPASASPDISQYIDFNQLLASDAPHTIIVNALGESMIDAGIADGDMLVVNRALEPRNNDIVIAAVDGEFTVKRYVKTSIGFVLRAENSTGEYPNIIPKKGNTIYFIGVVKHVIKAV